MTAVRVLAGLCLITAACGGSTVPSSPTASDSPGSGACRYIPAAAVPVFDAAGGKASASINTAAGCRWTIENVRPADSWIAVESSTTVGPATVSITAAANRSFTGRDGGFVVRHANGDPLATYAIVQRGAGCLYSVSPDNLVLPWLGTYDGAGDSPVRLSVHAEPSTCQWTARSMVPWIKSVYESGSGTGDGTLYLSTVVWNETSVAKIGEVVVAGLSGVNPDARVKVTQLPR